MGKGKKIIWTEEQIERIKDMYLEGKSDRTIAAVFGVTDGPIRKIVKPIRDKTREKESKLAAKGLKTCRKCRKVQEFGEFNRDGTGLMARCKSCIREKMGRQKGFRWTKETAFAKAREYEYITEFTKNWGGAYEYLKNNGWVELACSHMERKTRNLSREFCESVASQYEYLCDLMDEDYNVYAKCNVHFPSLIADLIKLQGVGFTRSGFIGKCDEKNTLGTFYVLKCWTDGEMFYKLGITSDSVKSRYSKRRMPYNYEILTEFKLEPGDCFDLERNLKSDLWGIGAYQPKFWAYKSTETFTDLSLVGEVLGKTLVCP